MIQTTNNVLLLSIRPQYAERIFNGSKRIELRRTRPRVKQGDIVVIYVSSPVKAIKGAFWVDHVLEAEPDKLWGQVGLLAGIGRDEYDQYYAGAQTAFGIAVSAPWSFIKPVGLSQLRELWMGFHPPQSYRYLTEQELNAITAHGGQVSGRA